MSEWHHRQQALHEIETIARGLQAGDDAVVMLSQYEIVNLIALLNAMGYAAVVSRNPLMVANTGDWVGQVYEKLGKQVRGDTRPNVDFMDLADRARTWSP